MRPPMSVLPPPGPASPGPCFGKQMLEQGLGLEKRGATYPPKGYPVIFGQPASNGWPMTPTSFALLILSTTIFIAAASSAKTWALSSNSLVWLALTLVLYTIGNLIMLRLIRDVGMASALSLSAVVQLVAVNAVALFFFGEKVTAMQGAGLVLAVLAVALISLPLGE